MCFSLKSGLLPLSPNCPYSCASLSASCPIQASCCLRSPCANPGFSPRFAPIPPLTHITHSPLELLPAFPCPRCPASHGTLLLPILNCKANLGSNFFLQVKKKSDKIIYLHFSQSFLFFLGEKEVGTWICFEGRMLSKKSKFGCDETLGR